MNIYFSDIDTAWLKRYESWLRGQEFSENTIGRRFRTLRLYIMSLLRERLPSRNTTLSSLIKCRNCTERPLNVLSAKRKYFGSSTMPAIVLMSDWPSICSLSAIIWGGINFVDMAYLTQQNIAEDYIRRKTHKMIKLTSLSQAMEIVVRNRRDQSPYLFPILSFYHTTEQQRRNRIRKVIAKINLCLKLINKELNIRVNLTTYVARHSFATALKRSGVSITNDPHTVPADYKAGQTL